MSEILQARTDIIKRLNVMVRKIEGVSSFVLNGGKQCPPSDIHVVIGTANNSNLSKIYSDINFLISEFLVPKSFNYKELDNRIIKNYIFENGVGAEVTICSEDNFPTADWWVLYLDENGAAQAFYGNETKCESDPVTDAHDDSEDEFTNDFDDDDDFDDDFDDQPQPQVVAPTEPESVPKQNADELWEYIYRRVALAKRAIAGDFMIHAGEIINELRNVLIKLICENSGIKENYIHSIDLLSNEYQKALAKTYPASLESGAMISALAAELSLFEQLIK